MLGVIVRRYKQNQEEDESFSRYKSNRINEHSSVVKNDCRSQMDAVFTYTSDHAIEDSIQGRLNKRIQ